MNEKLDTFLKKNNLEIVAKVELKNPDVAAAIKPVLWNLFLQCVQASYEVKEIEPKKIT